MAASPYSPDVLFEELGRGGPLLRRGQVERVLRLVGHAINANNGRCDLIERVLCVATTLCVEVLNDLDDRDDLRAKLAAAADRIAAQSEMLARAAERRAETSKG